MTQDYKIRGKLMQGRVIRTKSKKTAVVIVERTKYVPKYERYLVKKNNFQVHIPDNMDVSVGDEVVCGETRKISKTKYFVIIKKIDKKAKPEGEAK